MLALVAISLFVLLSPAQETGIRKASARTPPAPGQSISDNTGTYKRGTQDAPLIVEESAKEQQDNAAQQEKQKKENASIRSRDFILNLGIVIVGFFQFLVLGGQIFVYIRQTKIMGSNLAEAKRSADAARDSANDSRTTTRLTQCADVLIEGLVVDLGDTLDGLDTSIAIHFKNFGPTRATNVVFDFRLWAGTIFDIHSNLDPVVLGSLDSKPLIFNQFREIMSAEHVDPIFSGKAPMQFTGIIKFEDVFAQKHEIECFGMFNHRTRSFSANQTIKKDNPT